ncbi:hypothetical protein CDD80_4502 [Ophiocordyceps camponoti-rufipedis]|uniref:Uncharacterized protein n=1 Tax=Ophiocordyceps camponoti-rufipedis TaxID=2004952 RepID=A0A2C5YXL3_9HYPO|nr:hypothetical protein CDD80_4502 [Ophiocordyceps camponoti-rufipedis]
MESSESLLGQYEGREKQRRRWYQHWSVAVVVLVVYSAVLVGVGGFFGSRADSILTYTPAQEAIKFHKVHFDGSLGLRSPYTGEPRPETEAAWSRLFRHYNLRFTADEMRRMNRTALELRNGGGFYGQLSAYHHLHCLKMLRQVLWHDAYNVSIKAMRGHADHCIDDIRQSLMCHADLSVVTFDWLPGRRRPWPDFRLEQTCVDWGALDGWAAERSFSIFDQKTLVHPELGISFPKVNVSATKMKALAAISILLAGAASQRPPRAFQREAPGSEELSRYETGVRGFEYEFLRRPSLGRARDEIVLFLQGQKPMYMKYRMRGKTAKMRKHKKTKKMGKHKDRPDGKAMNHTGHAQQPHSKLQDEGVTDIVYRGDHRSPWELRVLGGIPPDFKGPITKASFSLQSHHLADGYWGNFSSAYASTSPDFGSAAMTAAGGAAGSSGWVYKIQATPNMINLAASVPDTFFLFEAEFPALGGEPGV